MDSTKIIETAIAYYKDKTQQEFLEKFQVESRRLIQADAEARRTIAREKVMAIKNLRIELGKFEIAYHNISSKLGNIEAVDAYILEIQARIKRLSYEKNSSR